MKEFLELAKTFRQTAVVDDEFPLWRDRFDIALKHKIKTTPLIVCLCGSTRFWRQFQESSLQETLKGNIVLSIGAARSDDRDDKSFGGYVPVSEFDHMKIQLDELHKRKIDLADEVLILNVDGYIGDSTKSELAYARNEGKSIRWLNPPNPSDPDAERKQF